MRMMIHDVGQGLAITIDYQKKVLIYDTGYGRDDFSAAEMTLLPWLDFLSISMIDLMIVGHNDADHAGGLGSVLNKWSVKKLMLGPDVVFPEKLQQHVISKEVCTKGQSWQWQQLFIKVLLPRKNNAL